MSIRKLTIFFCRNSNHLQKEHGKRKDVYYNFTRSDQLILLYNECLKEEEPIYTPRKFCNDNIFTMNEQEKNIYFKLDLTKLKTEMEVLTTKREFFRKNWTKYLMNLQIL